MKRPDLKAVSSNLCATVSWPRRDPAARQVALERTRRGKHRRQKPRTPLCLAWDKVFEERTVCHFAGDLPARGIGSSRALQKIRLHHILLHHSLRVEKRAIKGDGMEHDVEEAFPIVREHRQDHLFQFVVQ